MTCQLTRGRRGAGGMTPGGWCSVLILIAAGWIGGCGSGSSESGQNADPPPEAGYPPPTTIASRSFDLHWTISVAAIPADAKRAVLWIAIPQNLQMQTVSDLEVESGYPWDMVEDPDFHNRVVRMTVQDPPESLAVQLSARVFRKAVNSPLPASLAESERKLYLRQEGLVSLSPRIRALADSVGGDSRTRYDFVLNLMSYDKTAPGWGHGDSERACDVHKGNCTDFHSLFISLSRAEGVPALFEMGYPTVLDGETDQVGGYHCWAYFYDDAQQAWIPVDISEADQHPEKADFLFGHVGPDRITFSRGRDIRLPGMEGKPLNYLPPSAYVEVDGSAYEDVTRSLSYTVVPG